MQPLNYSLPMVVFLLSVCPNFSKGYAAIIHEFIQGTIPVFFTSYPGLISHSVMKPNLIVIKEEGLENIRTVVHDLLEDFPQAIVALGHFPDRSVFPEEPRSDRLYSFPLNEPEDMTMNHLMAKLVLNGVDFETNNDPFLGEAYDLFKKYLLLNSNLAICLSHIYNGDSATMIGSKMHLSPRTIEDYTNRLKMVFGCHTKKELETIYSKITNLSHALAHETLVKKGH